jgi:hypothetical protein
VGTLSFVGTGIQEDIKNLNLCDFNAILCQFSDPFENLVNVSSGVVTVRSSRYDPADPDGIVVNRGTLYNLTTGTYGYVLSPDDMEPGFYSVRFEGSLVTGNVGVPVTGYGPVTLPQTLCVEGQIKVDERTLEMGLVLQLRRRLKDLNTRLYRLDLPVQKWPDDEIIDALDKAVGEINAIGPMRTTFALRSLPTGVPSFVLDIAYADLLESQAIFENANTYSMSDGSANLSLSRAQMYAQIGGAVRTRTDQKVSRWKQSLVPNLHGQGTNQYPFQIRHVISFLPNFKNIFGA